MPIQVSDVRLDKLVKNVLLAKKNQNYLADAFLPTVSVANDSGDIPVWGDAHMRTYDLRRSVHDTSLHYVELESKANLTYKIDDFDVTHKIPSKLLEEQEDPYDLLAMSAMSAIEIVKLNRDKSLAAQLTSTSVLTQNETLSGSDQWSDANSTPFEAIEDGKTTILKETGSEANSIYMSYEVAQKLRVHADYINYYANSKTVPGGLSTNQLIDVLKDRHGFQNVYVGKTVEITSKQGQGSVTREFVFGKDCVIFHRASTPSILTPSFGYSFMKKGSTGPKTKTWFDTASQKFYNVEAKLSFNDKILMPEAAFLFKNAIA